MRIERFLGAALVLVASLAASAGDVAQPAAEVASEHPRFSAAEKSLWLGDQLQAIKQPSSLRYSFQRSGSYEQGFTDVILFTVSKVKANGLKDGSLQFFSGDRNFPVPPAEDTDANPVLKVYFQGDVYEMNRLTDPDGQSQERWRYFQRRVKLALAEAATVEPVTVEFAGARLDGKKISFQPYKDDPKRGEFEKFADKAYQIVVADALPGYLYSIETTIPGPPGTPPLIHEVLKLEKVEAMASAGKSAAR